MVKTVNSIRGKQFSQESLIPDLHSKIAGQTFVFKVILLLLIVIFCAIASLLSGFVGGIISLYVTIEQPASQSVRVTVLIIISVIAIAISQNLFRSILAVILALSFAAISSIPLTKLGFIQSPSLFTVEVLGATGFGLGVSSISFLILRFILALTDVLFIKSRYLKIAGIPIVILVAMAGSLGAISGQVESSTSPLETSYLPYLRSNLEF